VNGPIKVDSSTEEAIPLILIDQERIAEFIQDRVLPRFISMFLQNDTNGAPEAPGGQEGGFDVWIQTMLSELRTVVECNLLRILDDQ
jgi:hypothetical protein